MFHSSSNRQSSQDGGIRCKAEIQSAGLRNRRSAKGLDELCTPSGVKYAVLKRQICGAQAQENAGP